MNRNTCTQQWPQHTDASAKQSSPRLPPRKCSVVILSGELAFEARDAFSWLLLDQDQLTLRGFVFPAVFAEGGRRVRPSGRTVARHSTIRVQLKVDPRHRDGVGLANPKSRNISPISKPNDGHGLRAHRASAQCCIWWSEHASNGDFPSLYNCPKGQP